jgi:hypothetical protein
VQTQQPFILGELSEVHELAVFDMHEYEKGRITEFTRKERNPIE